MNEHLSPRARTVVACLGIRQRARAVAHFVREARRTGEPHSLAAASFHARTLRERAELALRDAQLEQAGVTTTGGSDDARRMG